MRLELFNFANANGCLSADNIPDDITNSALDGCADLHLNVHSPES